MTIIPLIAFGLIAKSVYDRSVKLNRIQENLQNHIDSLCGKSDTAAIPEVW